MARKTIRISDMNGKEIPEGTGATVRITFADARKGIRELDLTDAEAERLGGRQVARRGRRPKLASPKASFGEAKALIAEVLVSGDWIARREIGDKVAGRLSDPMFGRVKKELGIENRRVRGPDGRMRSEWRLKE